MQRKEDIEESGSLEKIGIVIGDATPTEFLFVSDENIHPPRWEYVLVRSREEINGEEVNVNVIAQVEMIYSSSQALSGNPELKTVEKIREAGLVDRRLFAKARVLGFLYDNEIFQPRRAIYPGNYVFKAPKNVLEKFYSYPDDEGLFIGYLISRNEVPVKMSIKGFRRHLAIIAQTGAGKSYTAGVILEELLKKGATAIVFDPHADYVFLSHKKNNEKFSDRISVFRTRESVGRYNESEIGRVNVYEVKFSDLSIDEIKRICGISEGWTNIIKAIEDAIKNLGQEYDLEDLINQLESDGTKESLKALNYIRKLNRIKVFGSSTTDIMKILKPKHISIMDLSGLSDKVSDYITFKLLGEIYEKVEMQQFKYPVFIILEEAHRFIPRNENTLSKFIMKRMAAEGRKFGIFLTLITQRPGKIDQDVLSQCNSQIIMRLTNPEDQKAVRSSSERLSEDLLNDLPGLNIGEAIIVGEVTKAPLMVKIRGRETREGGADIDIVKRLGEALKEVEEEDEKRDDLIKEEMKKIKDLVEGVE